MEIYLIAFIGGLIGSIFMDITEIQIAKFGISSGIKDAYIGRWAHGILRGTLFHQDIDKSRRLNSEERFGQLFHFVVGGGAVALLYPLLLHIDILGKSPDHLLFATLFGLLTCLLPWCILMPSFGWGLFGINAPHPARPITSRILSHVPYGFGIGLTFVIYNTVVS